MQTILTSKNFKKQLHIIAEQLHIIATQFYIIKTPGSGVAPFFAGNI